MTVIELTELLQNYAAQGYGGHGVYVPGRKTERPDGEPAADLQYLPLVGVALKDLPVRQHADGTPDARTCLCLGGLPQ